jgi:dTDP-4-dehydrorhamnose 3,5-epimerase
MIKGVMIKKLKINFDSRGRLMEILRSDDKIFEKFGQAYTTTAKPGVVKAWHMHKKQTDHFVCLFGKLRLALYDSRKKSSTFGEINEFILDSQKPFVVKIPKAVYHGFKGLAKKGESMVLNIPTMPYDPANPDEYRIDAFENDIPYNWRK